MEKMIPVPQFVFPMGVRLGGISGCGEGYAVGLDMLGPGRDSRISLCNDTSTPLEVLRGLVRDGRRFEFEGMGLVDVARIQDHRSPLASIGFVGRSANFRPSLFLDPPCAMSTSTSYLVSPMLYHFFLSRSLRWTMGS